MRNKESKHFDVIVVGAGPAGNTAAYLLAREGLDVLLLERGLYPGSKNVGGGAIAVRAAHEIIPNFWEDAPIERVLVDQSYWLLTEESALKIGFKSQRFQEAPYNKFILLKAPFDSWLAGKAKGEGAVLLTGHKVDELIIERGKVVGVRVGFPQEESYYAPVVILAEGANPMVAERAGLIKRPHRQTMSLYVKEIISLPRRVIEQRFNLRENEGAVIGLLGDHSFGLTGTASIYTNKDSLGINAGAPLETLINARINPNSFLERIKRHPMIYPLLEGGKSVEYTAHLIPDGGYYAIPKLAHSGALIIGDAAHLVNGTQGIMLAMVSASLAAQTVLEARRRGDFTEKSLALYPQLMKDHFIMKDLKANRRAAWFYSTHPDFIGTYTRIINEGAYHVAMQYTMAKREKRKFIFDKIREIQPLRAMLKDLFDLIRVIW